MKELPGSKTIYEVKEAYKAHKHAWQPTERRIPGGTLMLHVCAMHVDDEGNIKPAWKAYDLVIDNPDACQGATEYEQRSKHN